ncbi:MAG TPA: ABC transporter ATP-binding protein [Atopostipes sp.]|nr:ABC transporter ATP-binding protein [Atopostipes sp.]
MFKLFENLTKRDKAFMTLVLVFIIGQVWLELQLPAYMQAITILIQTPGSDLNRILSVGGLMVLAALGSLILSVLVAVLIANVSTNFAANLRELLFNKVLSLSMEDISGFSNASLITRSTNDITQIQVFLVMGLQMLIRSPIMATWAILRISSTEWAWTFATIIAAMTLFVIIGISMYFAIPKFKLRQQLTDRLNLITRENLTGIDVIRAYNAENYQTDKFEQSNIDFTDTNIFVNRIMAVMHPSIFIIMNALTLAIYWIGAFLIQNTTAGNEVILFSEMVVFSTYAMQVIMSLLMLIVVFAIFPQAKVSGDRIREVLDKESTIIEGTETKGNENHLGEIEFLQVSFQYPNAEEKVLEDISFKINPGETLAIIGATGSGKSTLINLIPRFYDVTSGEVLVNGRNVKEYTEEALNNTIGFVTQTAILFSGNIEENIAYGENDKASLTENDIQHAAKIAQASEFIEKLDEGYESHVAQSGTNFSGGQKQRISIARAIARDPEILIFDDSFSALDFKTDRQLRDALKNELAHTTKVIVAQRVGTIKDVDQIIVLENGKIAGMGTHKELLETNEIYQEIAHSQLSEEELA